MKVAFLSLHTSPLAPLGQKDTGGMNVYVRETAREMGRRGICVDIYTRCQDPDQLMIVPIGDNARVVHLEAGPPEAPKSRLHRYVPQFTANLGDYAKLLGLEYDLVHSHYWLSGLAALPLSKRWQAPLVASFHTLGQVQRLVRAEPEPEHRIAGERQVVHGADRIVAGSPDERERLWRLYGAPPEITHVVPCGYDARTFYPHEKELAKIALGLEASKIALFVGRMDRVKGAEIVLRAAAALEDKEELLILIVGGDQRDAETKRLIKLARDLGIAANLRFLGSVPQEQLPLYYSAADVCIVPSYYETFGLVAVEAMACGTPVIAARVGGLQATIMDGKTGYLVPWHCPEPYAERLETILGNDMLRTALGRAARESVEELSWSAVVDSLLDVYGAALGRPKEVLQLVSCA